MTIINNLAKYYKNCLYEEAKVSAFSNLRNEDNEIVKLSGYERVFHNYPTPHAVQEETPALTKLMLKSEMDKKKQLLYGYIFITGKLYDGTDVYTPLIYADCELERVGSKIVVSIKENTATINLPILSQILVDKTLRDNVLSEFVKGLNNIDLLPLTDESIKTIEKSLADLFPSLDTFGQRTSFENSEYTIHLNRENAVILTTINKGLAGVINDLDLISTTSLPVLERTALKAISDDKNEHIQTELEKIYTDDSQSDFDRDDLELFCNTFLLDDSQKAVTKKSGKDLITSITGGPGTGKSNTISAIATNYILNGKTVLICSKMNSAVDVVYNKLRAITNIPYCVRTGGKEYRKDLASKLDMIVNNRFGLTEDDYNDKLKYSNELYEQHFCQDRRDELISIYNDLKDKHTNTCLDLEKETNPIKRLFKQHKSKKEFNQINEVHEELCTYCNYAFTEDKLIEFHRKILDKFMRANLAKVLTDNSLRRQMTLLSKALQKSDFNKLDHESIFSLLVNEVLPCWCTTTVDVSSTIPAIAGLFDVVIIDEASQCDIATCLPLLYRAKRAVIVGDDKQLKYLSFLPNAVNNALIENAKLQEYEYVCNYRENSMFDFANYFSKGNVMLKYQYRGNGTIMGFSNKKFYNNQLIPKGLAKQDPLQLRNVIGGKVSAGKPVNHVEISAIIEEIKDIIAADEEKGMLVPTTIGVLSPFREQVKQLQKVISNVFTLEEIKKHKIIVGTAHSFQGEEREIMLISWTVADNSPIQSFTFINNPNLFNVSITRAHGRCINFLSARDLPNGLLREYIESI